MIPLRRAGSTAGAVLLAASVLVGCGTGDAADKPAAAQTPPTSSEPAEAESEQATAAAGWLAGELEGGLLSYTSQYGPFTDVGMSIDAAVALDRVGGHEGDVASIADAVAKDVGTYVEFPSGNGTHVSAGAVAKAAVMAEVAGEDPSDFGGRDLVAELEGLVGESGRIADALPEGNKDDADYANVIGQALAARALTGAGSDEADAVTGFLLDQQCEQGWFRLAFAPDPTGSAQACDDDPKAQPDPDTTALAVVHLSSLAEVDAEVQDAVDAAVAWLSEQQAEDGSLTGSQPPVANADTTGLAGWAFGEAGETEAAEAAAGWIAPLQLEDGAVAFDRAAFDRAGNGTIKPVTRSQWLLATAQAAPALLWYAG